MIATRPFSTTLVLSILATAACSGSTPQAESPTAAADPAPSPPSAPEAKADEPVEPAAPPAAAQAKESASEPTKADPGPAEEKPGGPPPRPSEILLRENVAFEIDDEASAIRIILKDKCEQRVGYESDAVERCLASERAKFPADVLRFRKMSGQLRWTVYKRKGDQLQVVFSAPFSFTEESDYAVSILPQGGTGYRPLMSQSRSVPLTFPTADSIQLDDPVWGQLVYKSKTGLADQ
jgi:hypothetical protein